MTTTRSVRDVYLIGLTQLESLDKLNQLPTIQTVLKRFHFHLQQIKSVRDASHRTVDELLILWSKATITTTIKRNCVEKLESVHRKWLLLKKNKSRISATQQKNEHDFQQEINRLFDVAHADAHHFIKIEEDKQFLNDQRDGRKMFMAGEDIELTKKRARSEERKQRFHELQRSSLEEMAASTSTACSSLVKTSSSDTDSSETEDGDDYKPAKKQKQSSTDKQHKTTSQQLFYEDASSALDRNKISDRQAVRIMIPFATSLGYDPSSLPISRSSIRRGRQKVRQDISSAVFENFNPNYPLVVHWDSKILPEITGAGDVDRLPVLVSGNGEEKLLGVPKLPSGTGHHAADAVYNLLEQWRLVDKVVAMSFDTTSVNTGKLVGACVILEKKIGRQLLWIPCRHHIMELILSKVFTLCFGPSSSPNIAMFQRFKSVWEAVEKDNFKALDVKQDAAELLQPVVSRLQSAVTRSYCREDYKELIELALVVLGQPPTKIHWRYPGPVHRARWMSKLIYAFKIFLFREQTNIIKLTKKELLQLERFVHFGSLLYVDAWTKSTFAIDAPVNDLQLWFDLLKYQGIDTDISNAARTVLQRHSWYLSDELVGLALFSDLVPDSDKLAMVEAMSRESGVRSVRGTPDILCKDEVHLSDFVTTRTVQLLHLLQIDSSFLTLPPEQWPMSERYQKGQQRVRNLRISNDTAERGVKMFSDYNLLLTKDEKEKQLILQVVEQNRKHVTTEATKQSAIDALTI